MGDLVVQMDEKGRIVIPKRLREMLGVRGKCYMEVSVEGDKIILKPVESIADKYYGIFKVKEWPKDLDEFLMREVTKIWLRDM